MAYPIVLKHRNQKVLIIGGGAVALRKARRLRRESFEIIVVALKFSRKAQAFFKQNGIVFVKRGLTEEDFPGVDLVFNTSGNEKVRGMIHRARKHHKFWLNDGCFPGDSDFHVPASYNQGDLMLSVYTHGKSPALGNRFHEYFEDCFGRDWQAVLEILGRERKRLLAEEPSEERRKELLRRMVEEIPEAMFEPGDLLPEEKERILENIQKAWKKDDGNGEKI
ncbi:precorrin-2 dehydrogenase/sirohydrochlorin ferrochelatase family protein [Isachenkonia alkalipeptolytica]|uniref:precorrin-2 dehydrogenase n=1 Tax=Isachenkonia alkalipeptolytica TaxID=2565777 RepID=A0AA43XIR8_9CLOT|nr:NAD(P)-dependent oxidoreductase [Isachenkonia alkalipeptolytica]NBG87094.1 hypothetical protein [Isachenkonia alkalipeptolytica]